MLRRHLLLACLALPATAALAASHATQKDAVAMADRAVAAIKAGGVQKLIERVNARDPEFLAGELYVVVLKADGTHLAHPVNPKLVGQAMLDIPDPDGRLFRKERVELAASKGKGWVDYKYKNPDTKKIEQKTAYVVKVDEVIVTVGAYKD